MFDVEILSPLNHSKSANNLLIVSQGNWSKLISKLKGHRQIQTEIAKIIALE